MQLTSKINLKTIECCSDHRLSMFLDRLQLPINATCIRCCQSRILPPKKMSIASQECSLIMPKKTSCSNFLTHATATATVDCTRFYRAKSCRISSKSSSRNNLETSRMTKTAVRPRNKETLEKTRYENK